MKIPGIFLLLIISSSVAEIIISEIFRDPEGPETALGAGKSHEFIEIFNYGDDTFFIDSLFLTDGGEADSIIPWNKPLPQHLHQTISSRFLLPSQIALILDQDYSDAIAQDPSCRLPVSDSALLLMCGDAELGGNGLSASEGVMIYKGTRNTINSVICYISDSYPDDGKISFSSPPNKEGISIVPVSFLFDTILYDYCRTEISPGCFELMKSGWIVDWRFKDPDPSGGAVTCEIKCLKPGGSLKMQEWVLEADSSGKRKVIDSGKIKSGKGPAGIQCQFVPGNFNLTFTFGGIKWPIDLSKVFAPVSSVKINEIFPRAVDDEPEWFELVNLSSMTVNLSGWVYGNNESTALLSQNDMFLGPGNFIVVTKDKKKLCTRYPGLNNVFQPPVWHTLGNFSDTLFLQSGSGLQGDMVCYESGWFTKWENRSLERAAPELDGCSQESWSVSGQSSPGLPNKALFWRNTERPSMEIGPIPFTPDGDMKNDLLEITMNVPSSKTFTLSIYSFDGRKVREFTGPVREKYLWDGRGDDGREVVTGPFFVIARIKTSGQTVMLRKKGLLWR